ncbi:uncharacterized protein TrAtP1_003356 [Trichoderma atroviride]|uniref:uncharacterized protein n=1 Tax=Hypocrea atroviridis TaxID=63577 RepID=UPI003322B026|nr:hypothetical protein TrAtP1_003356 [Trichoderma atroviride]
MTTACIEICCPPVRAADGPIHIPSLAHVIISHFDFLRERVCVCVRSGIGADIWMDPRGPHHMKKRKKVPAEILIVSFKFPNYFLLFFSAFSLKSHVSVPL